MSLVHVKNQYTEFFLKLPRVQFIAHFHIKKHFVLFFVSRTAEEKKKGNIRLVVWCTPHKVAHERICMQ